MTSTSDVNPGMRRSIGLPRKSALRIFLSGVVDIIYMTKHPDRDTPASDRPAFEIEITEEMERAGIAVLEGSGYLDAADSGFKLLASQVFRAMLSRVRN